MNARARSGGPTATGNGTGAEPTAPISVDGLEGLDGLQVGEGAAPEAVIVPRTSAVAKRSDATPAAASSWGLGDGQAIPWDYAPAPESRDIVTIRERYGLFINGREVAAVSGET